jgi:hypothetical protein
MSLAVYYSLSHTYGSYGSSQIPFQWCNSIHYVYSATGPQPYHVGFPALHVTMNESCVLALSTFIPGDAAWYWISLPYDFSGITVWHTDIKMRNSLIYGAVGCPDWRFCGTIMYHNILRLAVYCKVQDFQLQAETVS